MITVRSEEKGRKILENRDVLNNKLSYVIVKDIAEDGAFDEAVVSDPPFDAVVHTASPFHFNVSDPKKELLEPAIIGTTGILKAIKAKAPSVKRVAITSSFAAIINPKNHPKSYSEQDWNPVTMEEALEDPLTAYRASKAFAEKAAWDFVRNEQPNFQLTTLCPPLVWGPVVHYLNSLDALNTSNARIRDMIQGKMKKEPASSRLSIWVDVRDLAMAHVKAIELPEAAGKRFFVTAGYYSDKDIVDCIRQDFPELRSQLPPQDSVDDKPNDVFKYDNSRSLDLLGLKYRSLRDCVADTVKSLLAVGA